MGNTALAENELNNSEYDQPFDVVRPARRNPGVRRKAKRANSFLSLNWLTLPVLIACSIVCCVVGGFYVSAFANITLQAKQLSTINSRLLTANAQHEALMKQVAALESDHRIAPLVTALNMSQAGSNPYIDDVPPVDAPKEVASSQ